MKLVNTFLLAGLALSVLTCRALANEPFVENNRSFVWAEVPDALGYSEPGNINSEMEPWAVAINTITRHGDVVVFEGVSPEASYVRFQGDCRTQEIKTLYMGDFLSSNSIVYHYVYNDWSVAEGWRLAILNFVCAN